MAARESAFLSMRGFTLIETIVYLALFAIVMTGLVATVYGYFENTGRNETKAILQEEGNFVLGKINYALDGAQAVSAPASGATGGTLTATKYGSGLSTTITSSGGNVTQDGSRLVDSSVVTISSLTFTHIASPEGVTASFTITAKTPGGQSVSEPASITRYIRK